VGEIGSGSERCRILLQEWCLLIQEFHLIYQLRCSDRNAFIGPSSPLHIGLCRILSTEVHGYTCLSPESRTSMAGLTAGVANQLNVCRPAPFGVSPLAGRLALPHPHLMSVGLPSLNMKITYNLSDMSVGEGLCLQPSIISATVLTRYSHTNIRIHVVILLLWLNCL
jgi:hypothetical protein